jgi:dTDP-4-amino-4,6-dideoxygalactose transaminase
MLTTSKVPVLDLNPEIDEIRDQLMEAIDGVLRSTQFIMGPNVKAFETEVAEYLGVRHAVGLNSGTDALVIGLRALGVGPGDEVVTSPFTFFATGEAISHLGATPVFADIDPRTYNLDLARVAERMTPRTKAIVPVHLFGAAVDLDPLLELADAHGVKVLEDTAQAFGSEYRGRKVGAIGHCGAFSFFPSKNLGAFGDGGLLVTNDDELADAARMLRVHGARKKYMNETVGYNSRLDEMQAAILRVKLPNIDRWNEGRRAAAGRYNAMLEGVADVKTPIEPEGCRHVYHQYTIRIEGGRRDAVQEALAAEGIGSFVYYPYPLHKLPVYAAMSARGLEVSEKAALEVLSLPIWPHITGDVQERVCAAVRRAVGGA